MGKINTRTNQTYLYHPLRTPTPLPKLHFSAPPLPSTPPIAPLAHLLERENGLGELMRCLIKVNEGVKKTYAVIDS